MGAFYQLIFLGDTGCKACKTIRKHFFEKLNELGLKSSLISVLIGEAKVISAYQSNKPTFAYYFGNANHADKDKSAIELLMGNTDSIFPIYFTEGGFEKEIPSVMKSINGTCYTNDKLDSIVNVTFEEMRLLRKTRRVFVSYKRLDSSAVANQLFDVLSRHHFDVFLDTYSIRGSVDFQAELNHRITDSDVLIQLNSVNFMDSEWCKDEIKEANARRVGVLQINWPKVLSSDENQLSSVVSLSDSDFRRKHWKSNTSLLRANKLAEIVSKVEGIRARNIAARQDSLSSEFVKEAARQGRTIIKAPTFLVEQKSNGDFWYYITAIGVPKAEDCYDSENMLKRWNGELPHQVYLIYDDLSILPRWINHLEWLNQYLKVKTIPQKDFVSWLQTTK